ncbi:MAG: glycosyltransferase family 39 protein [Candidatus Solibacter sp.]
MALSAAILLAFLVWGPALDTPGTQGLPLTRTAVTAAIALGVFGLAYGSAWQRPVAILGIAAVGQACALGLVDTPNYAVLQRPFAVQDLFGSRRLFVLGQLLQATILAPMLWRRRRAIGDLLSQVLPFWKVALLAATFVVIAANASFDLRRFALDIAVSVWAMAVSLGWLGLACEAAPAQELGSVFRFLSERLASPAWERRLPWCCGAAVFLTSAAICHFVYGGVPHVPDEVSYLFQAKYFSLGRLYLPQPPDAAAFEVGQVFADGQKWFGYGFPGWPATLALGIRLGIPGLMNPLLAGFTILLAHRLVTSLYNSRIAHAVVLLLSVSPWFLFMSSSFMTHSLSLVLSLGGLLSIERQRNSRSLGWSIVAGLCLGAMVLTRPLEGVVIGLVMGFWAIGLGGERLRLPALAIMAVVSILLGSLILPYNRLLTGSPLRTAQQVWTDATFYPGSDRLGFGADIGNWGWYHLDPFPGHGLRDVLVNIHQNLFMSNFDLFGWGCGSMLFFGIGLFLQRHLKADRFLLSIGVAVVAAQSCYWFGGGPDYGPRYWYQLMIPFIVLSVRGMEELQKKCLRNGARLKPQHIALFAVFATLVAAVTIVPWRITARYHNFRRVTPVIRNLAKQYNFGKALIFVGGDPDDYPSAFVYNPPSFDSDGPSYVRDRGPASREVLHRHFPDRAMWFVRRAGTEDRFEVTAGPFSSAAAGHLINLE